MKQYGKLVRDRIPDIIKADGAAPKTHIADDAEYWEHLKKKLTEETGELLLATRSQLKDELADIMEVAMAMSDFLEIPREQLELRRLEKRHEKGGFKKRIILDAVE